MLQMGLNGHPSSYREDSGAECDLSCEGLAREVSEEKNISLRPGDHSGF